MTSIFYENYRHRFEYLTFDTAIIFSDNYRHSFEFIIGLTLFIASPIDFCFVSYKGGTIWYLYIRNIEREIRRLDRIISDVLESDQSEILKIYYSNWYRKLRQRVVSFRLYGVYSFLRRVEILDTGDYRKKIKRISHN